MILTIAKEGLFRSLLDCRIVLRSLRNLASLLGYSSTDQLGGIQLDYDDVGKDLKSIPLDSSPLELVRWAENRERKIYAELDSPSGSGSREIPTQVRFEGVLWLQSVRFNVDGRQVASRRMLMIDDLHKLRRKQRAMLIEEFTEIRPLIPVWLAERSIALGEELLSQGTREGRDLREYGLEELWSAAKGQYQFVTVAQNILDRRLEVQNLIPAGAFSQYLRGQFESAEIETVFERGVDSFRNYAERFNANARYSEWLARAENLFGDPNFENLCDLYVTRILLARDELKRQMTLELAPLPAEELSQRDNSQVQAAAEIFMNEELNVPYYFGIDRLCVMATSNVEELLSLAAALYEDLQAKQVLRKPDLLLSPAEQEKLLKEVAKRKRDFIPKNHTEGTRAQLLLDAIGNFCRDKTFLPNAPYAPGVTGIRLSVMEIGKLTSSLLLEHGAILRRVLAECVAENLLVTRASAASTSRDSGTIFYLNRTLCAHYGLPLQMGGWQDLSAEELIGWMERGRPPSRRKLLETR